MPVTVRQMPANMPFLAHVHGELSERAAADLVHGLYAEGTLRPGRDRLLVIEPEARLYRMDLAALTAHRDRVLAEERARGGPDFHLVIAARTRLHRPIAHLYAALWDLGDAPGARVSVVGTLEEALLVLGPGAGPPRWLETVGGC